MEKLSENTCGDNIVVDRLDLTKISEKEVGLEEITASRKVKNVDDQDDE